MEKLLNDLPAGLAGGIARPTLHPPQVGIGTQYSSAETTAEKQARLKTTALEIPILREGQVFEFSKLSGVGEITAHYWKRKTLLILQGLFGAALFVGLLWLMKMGRRLLPGLGVLIACFIAASLTDGFCGRMLATAFGASFAAFAMVCLIIGYQHHRDGTFHRASPAPPAPPPPPPAPPPPQSPPEPPPPAPPPPPVAEEEEPKPATEPDKQAGSDDARDGK